MARCGTTSLMRAVKIVLVIVVAKSKTIHQTARTISTAGNNPGECRPTVRCSPSPNTGLKPSPRIATATTGADTIKNGSRLSRGLRK